MTSIFIAAAFSNLPGRGNPAGVCILPQAIARERMQAIARGLRQPETAFLVRQGELWAIRWFSPATEVELCGHATLAAARILWDVIGEDATTLRFSFPGGILTARRGEDRLIWLDLPAVPGVAADPPGAFRQCAGTDWIAASRHGERWILECSDAGKVRAARPDFARLARTGARSLILTARSDMAGYHIVSRNFAPAVGVDEDQATGSAHACLAPYWRARLGPELTCWQASPRGGTIRTRLNGAVVSLGGHAVIEERCAAGPA